MSNMTQTIAPRPAPIRRTKFGLTLVLSDGTWWRTEDDHWEIGEVREITTCDEPHPVRFSKEDIRWAYSTEERHPQYHPHYARFLREQVMQGKRGYLCENGEHDRPCGWDIRAITGDGGQSDLFPTLTEAWQYLAAKLVTA